MGGDQVVSDLGKIMNEWGGVGGFVEELLGVEAGGLVVERGERRGKEGPLGWRWRRGGGRRSRDGGEERHDAGDRWVRSEKM